MKYLVEFFFAFNSNMEIYNNGCESEQSDNQGEMKLNRIKSSVCFAISWVRLITILFVSIRLGKLWYGSVRYRQVNFYMRLKFFGNNPGTISYKTMVLKNWKNGSYIVTRPWSYNFFPYKTMVHNLRHYGIFINFFLSLFLKIFNFWLYILK